MASKKAELNDIKGKKPMTTGGTPICIVCKHLEKGKLKCRAFPDKIPEDIIRGRSLHMEPYPGANGVQFEPRSEGDLARWADAYKIRL